MEEQLQFRRIMPLKQKSSEKKFIKKAIRRGKAVEVTPQKTIEKKQKELIIPKAGQIISENSGEGDVIKVVPE